MYFKPLKIYEICIQIIKKRIKIMKFDAQIRKNQTKIVLESRKNNTIIDSWSFSPPNWTFW